MAALSPMGSESGGGGSGRLRPVPRRPRVPAAGSAELAGDAGAGIPGPDPPWEALLASATRDSSKEVLGALLTEWVVYYY